MENQILFVRVFSFITAVGFGIIGPVIAVKLLKSNFSAFTLGLTIGVFAMSLGVGVITGILMIFFPYHEGFYMDWGSTYLRFVLWYLLFYIISLATTWLLTRKKAIKN